MAGVIELAAAVFWATALRTKVGERPSGTPVRGIPADVAWYAYACSQCGYCVDECDQYYEPGMGKPVPRGKWLWLREYIEGRQDWNQKMVNTFLACTTCELCVQRCSAALPIEPSWMKLRGHLIRRGAPDDVPAVRDDGGGAPGRRGHLGGLPEEPGRLVPGGPETAHGPGRTADHVYFAGCTASYVEPDIAIATVRLLDKAGIDFTYLGTKESCCAVPCSSRASGISSSRR